MDTSSLTKFISENAAWYSSKGKNAKRLSIASRGVTWLFATSALLSMTMDGASSQTVILALCAAATIALDKTFGFTRNWLEFTAAEIALNSARTQIDFLSTHNGTREEVMEIFTKATGAIEAETIGWRSDVLNNLEELRRSATRLNRKD